MSPTNSAASALPELEADRDWWVERRRYGSLVIDDALRHAVRDLMDLEGGPDLASDAFLDPTAIVNGPVRIERGAKVLAGTTIEGPAIIRNDARIGPNAYLRGGVLVGPHCVVGFGVEVKCSILLSGMACWHHSYVGHSIIGHGANLGAGFLASVQRLDGKPVGFGAERPWARGKKAGVLVGDGSRCGVRVCTMPGSEIEAGSLVLPDSNVGGSRGAPRLGRSQQVSADDVQLWSTLLSGWDKEADRFWSRNNVFLLVNGALIAVVTATELTAPVRISASGFGILSCVFWYAVNRIGKHYIARWHVPIRDLEANWQFRPFALIQSADEPTMAGRRMRASSTYMQWLIVILGFLWAATVVATVV